MEPLFEKSSTEEEIGRQDSMLTDVRFIDTQNGDRQTGRKAQLSNITAAKTCVQTIRGIGVEE